MQLSVTFPDTGFPDVVFTASGESLVKDALQVAADEWGTDADFLELSLAGSRLRAGSRLVSYGVEDGSLLDASVVRLFGLEWFTDVAKRAKAFLRGERDQDGFLCLDTPRFAVDGCLQFNNSEWFSDDVTNISFSNSEPSVTTVSDGFLSSSRKVIKISLPGLQYVTSVGNQFLCYCDSLSSVDLSSLSNLSAVGNYFLRYCSSLTSLDLSSLSNVSAVGDGFLYSCSSLTSLDLSSLSNVSAVGNYFLSDCSSLTSLDLSGLSNVSAVGDHFLCYCTSLTSLDLTLMNVESVGGNFLEGCSSMNRNELHTSIKSFK